MEAAFLSAVDLNRVERALHRLAKHDMTCWALTGGIAIELHLLHHGKPSATRALNDLDFIVESFEHIPVTLAEDFLFRHIHPTDPPGKALLQCIDTENTLRIDVFRAASEVIARSNPIAFADCTIRVVSLEDITARLARLVLEIAKGLPINARHAKDFVRLDEIADVDKICTIWEDHRKEDHPHDFLNARAVCLKQITGHPELLVSPCYSRNPNEFCPRCSSTPSLRLADPQIMLDIMGYC